MTNAPPLATPPNESRRWCLYLAIALVFLGALSNIFYLWHNCPIDLSEDESHYWEWSRHLDYGYYSKPPGIAWVIWLATKIGGNSMPAVRMPAVLFGLLSGLLSLFLARRIFRDNRAALAVIALSAAVPMFAVGTLLITIDSPMYLSWAASVYCLWRAVEATEADNTRSPHWLYGAALAAGLGMLFKPVLIAIPLCAAIAAIFDAGIRRALKRWHSLGAVAVFLLSLVPTIIWNWQHNWVTFKHIATQGGFVGPADEKQSWLAETALNFGKFLGGQAGGMGGAIFVLLVIAVVLTWRWSRQLGRRSSIMPLGANAAVDLANERTRWVFLLSFALPLWLFYFLMNFWKGTEPNWPAASYFSAMILLAGLFVREWNSTDPKIRRRWRAWGTGIIAWGFLLSVLAMNIDKFYPLAARHLDELQDKSRYTRSLWFPGKWDVAAKKLRGFTERGQIVARALDELRKETGQEPLIVTRAYDTSSSLAFYVPGQPFVYCIMSSTGARQSQYDLWPGINQKDDAGNLKFAGRPMLFVGIDDPKDIDAYLRPAFDHLSPPTHPAIWYHGVRLRDVPLLKAYGFKGLPTITSSKY